MKRRTDFGGSTITTIVVGLILTLGLIGAIYFVNQQNEQARKKEAEIAFEEQQKDNDNVVEADDSETKTETQANTSTSSTSPEALPATGAKNDMLELVGVFVMTSSIVAYASSRRN